MYYPFPFACKLQPIRDLSYTWRMASPYWIDAKITLALILIPIRYVHTVVLILVRIKLILVHKSPFLGYAFLTKDAKYYIWTFWADKKLQLWQNCIENCETKCSMLVNGLICVLYERLFSRYKLIFISFECPNFNSYCAFLRMRFLAKVIWIVPR